MARLFGMDNFVPMARLQSVGIFYGLARSLCLVSFVEMARFGVTGVSNLSARFKVTGNFLSLARSLLKGVLCYMARLPRMGIFFFSARFLVMGNFTTMARLGKSGYLSSFGSLNQ